MIITTTLEIAFSSIRGIVASALPLDLYDSTFIVDCNVQGMAN
jgi:hypothetical protein